MITRLPPNRQTLNPKVNMIWKIIFHYTKWCCGDHMIYNLIQFLKQNKPVHFLREHLCHIIMCHWYIHTLQYPYHITNANSLWKKSPSITIVCPIIASKRHTSRKFYVTQQPTQTGTMYTNWPLFKPNFIRFFFIGLILLIVLQVL